MEDRRAQSAVVDVVAGSLHANGRVGQTIVCAGRLIKKKNEGGLRRRRGDRVRRGDAEEGRTDISKSNRNRNNTNRNDKGNEKEGEKKKGKKEKKKKKKKKKKKGRRGEGEKEE